MALVVLRKKLRRGDVTCYNNHEYIEYPLVVTWCLEIQLSHEKYPGCLGYIGDEILPSYIGITINHYFRIPINQPVYWKVVTVFFVAQLAIGDWPLKNTTVPAVGCSLSITIFMGFPKLGDWHFRTFFVKRKSNPGVAFFVPNLNIQVVNTRLGGFKDFLFSPLFGEDSHVDQYFSDGLKPPSSIEDDEYEDIPWSSNYWSHLLNTLPEAPKGHWKIRYTIPFRPCSFQ